MTARAPHIDTCSQSNLAPPFVFTLGYSGKCVHSLTVESSARCWAELHDETFRRPGGAVRVVVLGSPRRHGSATAP
jgi:hypothetical protein